MDQVTVCLWLEVESQRPVALVPLTTLTAFPVADRPPLETMVYPAFGMKANQIVVDLEPASAGYILLGLKERYQLAIRSQTQGLQGGRVNGPRDPRPDLVPSGGA